MTDTYTPGPCRAGDELKGPMPTEHDEMRDEVRQLDKKIQGAAAKLWAEHPNNPANSSGPTEHAHTPLPWVGTIDAIDALAGPHHRRCRMTPRYRVHVGYTMTGRDRWRPFATLAAALELAEAIYQRSGVFVVVEEDR